MWRSSPSPKICVQAWASETPDTLLARFEDVAAKRGDPLWVRINHLLGVDMLETILMKSSHAHEIHGLVFSYCGSVDADRLERLVARLHGLKVLDVYFYGESFVSTAAEFATRVLFVWGCGVTDLTVNFVPEDGDAETFFRVLAGSRVRRLTVRLPKVVNRRLMANFHKYLQKDQLDDLNVLDGHGEVVSLVGAAETCQRLATLRLSYCEFTLQLVVPACVLNLEMWDCLTGYIDWSATLKTVNMLDLRRVNVDVAKLACAMKGGALRDLTLLCKSLGELGEIDGALRSPDCRVEMLWIYSAAPGMGDKECEIGEQFDRRRSLLTLLQGRVCRFGNPLKRLPVEMFRMVGMAL